MRANQVAKGCRERLRAARNISDVALGRLNEEQAEVKQLRARVMWWEAWWAELPGWLQKVKAVGGERPLDVDRIAAGLLHLPQQSQQTAPNVRLGSGGGPAAPAPRPQQPAA